MIVMAFIAQQSYSSVQQVYTLPTQRKDDIVVVDTVHIMMKQMIGTTEINAWLIVFYFTSYSVAL